MKLLEIYDTRSDYRREAGDLNYHTSVEKANAAIKGFWIMDRSGKKLSGPYATREKAESFKANRPDRIPRDAIIKEI